MNLFILSKDVEESAQMQCDKHAVKMIVESAQMLSTAHRMLDGKSSKAPSKSGKRMVNHWKHPDENLDEVLYKAVHHYHPCTVWTMKSNNNYTWHYAYFVAMCKEFEYRFGKVHSSWTLLKDILCTPPRNIEVGPKTQFPLAMKSNPECMFPDDPVKSYRLFYQTKQFRFKMRWTNRPVPNWFTYQVGAK